MWMPSIAAGRARVTGAAESDRAALWLALGAVVLLGCINLAADPSRLLTTLGDTDDATRLVQVRGLLAGAPWFDTTLASIGAPQPLVSHWSRLVDLPLALLIRLFALFAGVERAETMTRFVWPLLVLLPLTWVIAEEARRHFAAVQAGRLAAAFAAFIVVTSLSGLVQYLPGRIDHHNCMILGAIAGVIFAARSFEEPRAGWIAGIAFGMSLSVGYEGIALIAPSVAIAAAIALVSGRGIEGVTRLGIALAGTLAVALVATTAPSRLLVSHCDALSLNLVLLSGTGAAGLALVASQGRGWPLWRRLAVPAAVGIVGLALYGAAEPACLKGPFGQIDPAIRPIWLDEVPEAKTLFWLFTRSAVAVVDYVLFAAISLVAAWRLWRIEAHGARLGYRLAILVLANLLAVWQIKLLPYATFLSAFPIAVWLAGLRLAASGDSPVAAWAKRIAPVLAANQLALIVVAAPLGAAMKPVAPDVLAWQDTVARCLATDAFKPLAALPPGLVLSDDDLGPYIAALTPLRATSGPYHRLDKSIILTNRILEGSVADAETRLKALGADYVAVCPGLRIGATAPDSQGNGPFEAQLWLGKTPAYLEPITLPSPTPIKVWRVRK